MLAALIGALLGGCQQFTAEKSESHAYTGTAGDHIGDDYVYYPTYEVYYTAARKEYVYYDGKAWVRTTQPSDVWGKTMDKTPSVAMTFHDDPERHHAEIVRQYPHTWQPATATATAAAPAAEGQPSPTTNDPIVNGTKN